MGMLYKHIYLCYVNIYMCIYIYIRTSLWLPLYHKNETKTLRTDHEVKLQDKINVSKSFWASSFSFLYMDEDIFFPNIWMKSCQFLKFGLLVCGLKVLLHIHFNFQVLFLAPIFIFFDKRNLCLDWGN